MTTFGTDGAFISDVSINPTSAENPHRRPSAAAIDSDGKIWLFYAERNLATYACIGAILECHDSNSVLVKSVALDIDPSDWSDLYDSTVVDLIVSEHIYIGKYDLDSFDVTVHVFDDGGAQLFKLEEMRGICQLLDGRVVAIKRAAAPGENSVFEIDVAKGGLGEEIQTGLPRASSIAYYASGNGSFYMLECTKGAIYGYSFFDNSRFELVNMADLKLQYFESQLFRHTAMLGDDIYCLLPGDLGIVSLIKLARTDSPPVPGEKTVVTLAAFGYTATQPMLNYSVDRFNKTNPDYDLQIKTYFDNDVATTMDTAGAWNSYWDDCQEAFHLDLIAGNIPDIIFVSFGMPFEDYARHGLFADLYEFIDKDPDMEREDYIQSVLNTLELDGRLYGMADYFSINTLVGRASDVGANLGWTFDDFVSLMERKPAGTIPMSWPSGNPSSDKSFNASANRFFTEVFLNTYNDFVDYASGTCSFDSPAFISLLETSVRYCPKEGKY